MYLLFALALGSLDLPVRSVALSAAALTKPISIECPVGQLTRVVSPERLVMLKASAGAADALAVAAEESSPLGVISIRPTKARESSLQMWNSAG